MARMSMQAGRAGDIDAAIGRNIRRIRKARGWSQEALAASIGLTFQQVQKYERGVNRVSCAKLLEICEAMGIEPLDILPGIDRSNGGAEWVEQAQTLYYRSPSLLSHLERLKDHQLNALLGVAMAF